MDNPVEPQEPETPTTPVENTPSPEQQFLQDYQAFCKEKGYTLLFEIKPILDKDTHVYDLSKVTIVITVAKAS